MRDWTILPWGFFPGVLTRWKMSSNWKYICQLGSPSWNQAMKKFLLCVPEMDNQSQTRKKLLVQMNPLMLHVQEIMKTRTVKLIKVLCGQPSPPVDMQSKEPAMESNFKKKHIPLCKGKNYQTTIGYKKQKKLNIMTLKVNLQGVLTRTVKKIKKCGQWSQKWICSYPNQQLQECVMTRTVNLQDVTVTRRGIMTETVNLMCNLNLKELCYF